MSTINKSAFMNKKIFSLLSVCVLVGAVVVATHSGGDTDLEHQKALKLIPITNTTTTDAATDGKHCVTRSMYRDFVTNQFSQIPPSVPANVRRAIAPPLTLAYLDNKHIGACSDWDRDYVKMAAQMRPTNGYIISLKIVTGQIQLQPQTLSEIMMDHLQQYDAE